MKFLGDSLGKPIAIVTLALSVIGLLAVLSASASTGASDPACGYNSLYFFIRQFISLGLGVGLLAWARYKVNLDEWRMWLSLPALMACIGLAVAVLFSPAQNGAQRWLHLGFFNVQVGEICKLVLVCFWADFLAKCYARLGQPTGKEYPNMFWLKRWGHELLDDLRLLMKPIIATAIVLCLIEAGHDLGTVVLIFCSVLAMLYVAGLPNRVVVRGVIIMTALIIPLLCMQAYRMERMYAWVNPMKFKESTGYQAVNSFMAIAGGGLWGKGVPFSAQKYGFLPEQHTDFIYAVICEEIGFVGSMGIFALFAILCYCGFRLASRCKDPYRAMLAFGISCQMTIQVLINLSVVTGLAPNKGLPLPLISYGGSSMCMTLFSIGLLLNISDTYRRAGVVSKKRVKEVKRIDKARTLACSMSPYPSSSSDLHVSPISSGEWRKIVQSDPVNTRPRLPEPRVKEGWKVVDVKTACKERQERLRKMRKLG